MPQTGYVDIARARFLVSAAGRAALAEAPDEWNELPLHTLAGRLRLHLPAVEAAAVGEQIALQQRAGLALWRPRLLLTAEGLQMATHPAVARRRAKRLAELSLPVADLTAGLGCDLWACIEAGMPALGVERDPATALLAASNTEGCVVRGDATRAPVDPQRSALIIDPSRRTDSGRRFDPAAFSPPWGVVIEMARAAAAAVVKGPPGISHAAIPLDCEVEFVQFGRGMREAALWFGAEIRPGLKRAVLLPGGDSITSAETESTDETSAPQQFIFDPESCVTRAGLVRHLAHQLGATLMDPKIAYLTAPAPTASPLAACFEVLDALPFAVGRLKTRLRERGWRPDEVRRRGFPVEPDELRRLLGRLDGEPVTLLCTTIGDRRMVFIARQWRPGEEL